MGADAVGAITGQPVIRAWSETGKKLPSGESEIKPVEFSTLPMSLTGNLGENPERCVAEMQDGEPDDGIGIFGKEGCDNLRNILTKNYKDKYIDLSNGTKLKLTDVKILSERKGGDNNTNYTATLANGEKIDNLSQAERDITATANQSHSTVLPSGSMITDDIKYIFENPNGIKDYESCKVVMPGSSRNGTDFTEILDQDDCKFLKLSVLKKNPGNPNFLNLGRKDNKPTDFLSGPTIVNTPKVKSISTHGDKSCSVEMNPYFIMENKTGEPELTPVSPGITFLSPTQCETLKVEMDKQAEKDKLLKAQAEKSKTQS